jgi:hypothetical protein
MEMKKGMVCVRTSRTTAKQSEITAFFTKPSLSLAAMHSAMFDHPDNFQPRTPMSFK